MSKLRGWKFPVDVDKATGKIMTVEDNDNVKQSIKLILKTHKGERKMRSNFGTNINSFLFQNIDLTLINMMSKEISRSIDLWEEHLSSLKVNVKQSGDNMSTLLTEVDFVTDILPTEEKISNEYNLDKLHA